ncbi:heavy metal translocating P-type ATPase [Vibrio hangzhouensis]|uniref:Copper-exporting P-type ATPase n=1 Tax=Vibrio hangzhouensis TaxID=462991 RepID=A0A1H5UQ65_9VIBR|nr:heavy metal translocating P-type ATPase [Vibrio hangzhouensis]SEF77199.1 Cu+-exporting ATPase [Vibrio hangzhouensis]
MDQYTLNLSGLSCMGCVNKLKKALEASPQNIEIVHLTKEQLVVSSEAPVNDVISVVESLGYRASLNLDFQLTGLNCGKCVAKLREHLSSLADTDILELSKNHLSVQSSCDSDIIIEHIRQIGFDAKLIAPSASTEPKADEPDREPVAPSSIEPTQPKQTPEGQQHLHYLIQGMTCASCVSSVEKALTSVDGVTSARVNLAEQSAMVSTDELIEKISPRLLTAISQAGYQGELVQDLASSQAQQQKALLDHQAVQKKNTIVALAVGAPLMLWGLLGGNMMIRNPMDQMTWGLIGILCLWLLATSGRDFYVNAYKALQHKRATMDTLVALGTGAAWFYSMLVVVKPGWFPHQSRHVYFEASAMIVGLISLGHYIEAKAKSKTNQSLQALMNLQPQHATAIIDGKDTRLAVADIALGMRLRIKPGEKVPVDGLVTDGHSYVDESMLTGEPVAVLKGEQDRVSAGTMNTDGSLVIEATGVGSNTMLSRIINLVREAQSSKPAIAKLADSISAIFVPVVVVIAILAAAVWFFVGPEPKASYMLVVTTTVLIIACPCALGLATPLSITVGIGKAAQAGVLIKDADALQKLSKVNAVVFDKTGTLTLGEPKVQRVFTTGLSESELAHMVLPLEKRSEHPLAKAVTQYWTHHDNGTEPEKFVNLRGKGVEGVVAGQNILISSLNYVQSLGIDTTPINGALKQAVQLAATPVIVIIEKVAVAVIAVADEIKPEAFAAVSALKKQGIHTVMLTGDHYHVANNIGQKVGIDEVISQVLPDEKASHILSLKDKYTHVAMVGDGINDAPALATADVGIAMGSGSDVAIESAPMTLLNSNPATVSYAISLSKATVKNIKQNLFGAFIYNSLGIPIAAGVLYPIFGFLLSPVFAGAAMALSSITVVSNANRLRNFQYKG